MALIRWEPAAELNTIQNEMNRLFNTFFDQPAPTSTARRWLPPMDLLETAEHYVLRADLPACPTATSTSSSRTTCSPSPVSATPSTNSSRRATTGLRARVRRVLALAYPA